MNGTEQAVAWKTTEVIKKQFCIISKQDREYENQFF